MRFLARLDEKHNLLELFEKIFESFHKNIAKNALFLHIFQKNYQTMRYFFARLDEKLTLLGNFEKILKIFDENSIEKLIFNFNFIFRKFVTKNRAFGNNTIFLQQFFRFRGVSPFPPGYVLDCHRVHSTWILSHLSWENFRTIWKIGIQANRYLTGFKFYKSLILCNYLPDRPLCTIVSQEIK